MFPPDYAVVHLFEIVGDGTLDLHDMGLEILFFLSGIYEIIHNHPFSALGHIFLKILDACDPIIAYLPTNLRD